MTLNCMGRVNVTAPGTPVPLSAESTLSAAKLFIQTIPGLTSKIYVGTAGLDKSTLAGVCRILWPNPNGGICDQFEVSTESGTDQIQLSHVYLDSDVAGEGVLVSYWVE